MADSEKPFACPSPGCNMSFINEDHLTVHKKRHDMMLNLEASNKNNVFIDQTPTPTRFIKNCEELGLFQDLQHVNPFEETFRRAVEGGKTGTLSVSDTDISDDTLHTPHIFPHITECQPANGQIIHTASGIDELSTVVTTAIDVTKTNLLDSTRDNNHLAGENAFHHQNTDDLTGQEKRPKLDEQPFETTETKTQYLSINGEDVQLLLKTADGKLMQLTAIPINENVESRASAASDREDFTTALSSDKKLSAMMIKTNPPLKCSKTSNPPLLSLAKLKLKQTLMKGSNAKVNQSRGLLTRDDKEEDIRATLSKENVGKKRSGVEQNKKQELRERNRASSMRFRAKRKEWIQQLQQTISRANEKNAVLQLEIKNLHTEIARLKTLLLAHKDCPITKAMEKGNNVLIGPKVINVNPEVVSFAPQLPVNTSLPVIPSTSPISVKKGRFAKAPPPKNPIILPKPEVQPLQIHPASLTNKISPIVRIITTDNLADKQNNSKPQIISDSVIVHPQLKIVDKIIIAGQLNEPKTLFHGDTVT